MISFAPASVTSKITTIILKISSTFGSSLSTTEFLTLSPSSATTISSISSITPLITTTCGTTLRYRKKNKPGSGLNENRRKRMRNKHHGRGSTNKNYCAGYDLLLMETTTKGSKQASTTKHTKKPKKSSETSSDSESKEKRIKKRKKNRNRH